MVHLHDLGNLHRHPRHVLDAVLVTACALVADAAAALIITTSSDRIEPIAKMRTLGGIFAADPADLLSDSEARGESKALVNNAHWTTVLVPLTSPLQVAAVREQLMDPLPHRMEFSMCRILPV